jgi:chromosome segregation ATPase
MLDEAKSSIQHAEQAIADAVVQCQITVDTVDETHAANHETGEHHDLAVAQGNSGHQETDDAAGLLANLIGKVRQVEGSAVAANDEVDKESTANSVARVGAEDTVRNLKSLSEMIEGVLHLVKSVFTISSNTGDEVMQRLGNVKDQVDNLTELASTTVDATGDLQGGFAAASDDWEGVMSEAKALEDDLETILSRVSALGTKIEETNGRHAGTRSSIDLITTDTNVVTDDVKDVAAELRDISEKLDAYKQGLATMG